MLGWLILWDRFFLLFQFGSPMQQNVISVGDNDDIPKITAIDYDRLDWCRVSSRLKYFTILRPGIHFTCGSINIQFFSILLSPRKDTRWVHYMQQRSHKQSECVNFSFLCSWTKPYERSSEKIDCNFWQWILTSILFLFKLILIFSFYNFVCCFFISRREPLPAKSIHCFRQFCSRDINHVNFHLIHQRVCSFNYHLIFILRAAH